MCIYPFLQEPRNLQDSIEKIHCNVSMKDTVFCVYYSTVILIFFIKIHDPRECMRMYMPYFIVNRLLTIDYFVLSRKHNQRNNIFKKKQNLNLKVKF